MQKMPSLVVETACGSPAAKGQHHPQIDGLVQARITVAGRDFGKKVRWQGVSPRPPGVFGTRSNGQSFGDSGIEAAKGSQGTEVFSRQTTYA